VSDRRGYIVPIGGSEEKIGDRKILKRFVRICGGRDARIAIIPTASHLKETGRDYERLFKKLGVRSARSLDFQRRSDGDRREWLDRIERATGVFMTGGHQLRLATTIGNTKAAKLIRKRNRRGLHVAGTSAGASFMARHMIGYGDEGPTPLSGQVNLCPGLGLLPDLIIDQHFRQRDRLGRLISALSHQPGLIGLGLDEDTAAFIGPDDELEAVGSGGVTVVDSTDVEFSSMDLAGGDEPVSVIGLRLHILIDGGTFDIVTREASSGVTISARG